MNRKNEYRTNLPLRLSLEEYEVVKTAIEHDTGVDTINAFVNRMVRNWAKRNKHIVDEYKLTP